MAGDPSSTPRWVPGTPLPGTCGPRRAMAAADRAAARRELAEQAAPAGERRAVVAPISDPRGGPYAIIARRRGVPGGDEIHLLPSGRAADWAAHAEELAASGAYEWVRWVSMGFTDLESGEVIGA